MKKRLLAMVMTLAMGVSLAGCGSSSGDSSGSAASTTSTNTDKESLVIATMDDPSTFAPNDTFNDAAGQVTAQIYDRLFYINADGEYIYRCADSVEQEDDTHILINLRKGIKDSIGNELTASDIIFDIQHLMDTPFSSSYTVIDLNNSEIVDDYSLRLALTQPYGMELSMLQGIMLFDEDSFKASSDEMVMTPVGYGPYYLESYTAGTEVILKARDDYWDGEPAIKNVTYKIITEATQRTNSLAAGGADMAIEVQISDVDYLDSNEGTSILQKEDFASHGIVFNLSEISPLNDIHLRKAIAYAINTEAIIQVSYQNTAKVPVAMFSDKVLDYDEDAWNKIYEDCDQYYAYNLEKAKQEMAQSAYPDGVTLQAIHYTANNGDTNSELVQSMLSEIGIKLEITSYDNATVNDMLINEPEKWDMAFSGWYAGAQYSAAIASLQIVGNNFCNWSGADFDTYCAAVAKAESASNEESLVADCVDVVRLSSEQLPFLQIADYNTMFGLKDGLNLGFYANHTISLYDTSWD